MHWCLPRSHCVAGYFKSEAYRMSYTPLATSTAATSATTIASTGQTFQITGSPVTVAGKVITKLPLPANSKIVAVNVPATQGGKGSVESFDSHLPDHTVAIIFISFSLISVFGSHILCSPLKPPATPSFSSETKQYLRCY